MMVFVAPMTIGRNVRVEKTLSFPVLFWVCAYSSQAMFSSDSLIGFDDAGSTVPLSTC